MSCVTSSSAAPVVVLLDPPLLQYVTSFMSGPALALAELRKQLSIPSYHSTGTKMTAICKHALQHQHQSTSNNILRMLKEYCLQPCITLFFVSSRTRALEAQWSRTRWRCCCHEMREDLLDRALTKILTLRHENEQFHDWSETHRHLAMWLYANRPECWVSISQSGLNGAATQEFSFLVRMYEQTRSSFSLRRCNARQQLDEWRI